MAIAQPFFFSSLPILSACLAILFACTKEIGGFIPFNAGFISSEDVYGKVISSS